MWANSSIPQIVMQNTMDYHSVGIFTSAVALANIILLVQAGFNTFGYLILMKIIRHKPDNF